MAEIPGFGVELKELKYDGVIMTKIIAINVLLTSTIVTIIIIFTLTLLVSRLAGHC